MSRSVDPGRSGTAKRLPHGSQSRCRIASTHTMAAIPTPPRTAATAGTARTSTQRTLTPVAARCSTSKVPVRRRPCMQETLSSAGTPAVTTSSSSTSPTPSNGSTPDQGRRRTTGNSHGDIPIAVLCDNSRDLDRMPSDLSDFTLYGGLYRHVNLVYVPATSLETVHIRTSLETPGSPAEAEIVASLYNPAKANEPVTAGLRGPRRKGCARPYREANTCSLDGRKISYTLYAAHAATLESRQPESL